MALSSLFFYRAGLLRISGLHVGFAKFHENFIGMKDVWLESDEYMYSDGRRRTNVSATRHISRATRDS